MQRSAIFGRCRVSSHPFKNAISDNLSLFLSPFFQNSYSAGLLLLGVFKIDIRKSALVEPRFAIEKKGKLAVFSLLSFLFYLSLFLT